MDSQSKVEPIIDCDIHNTVPSITVLMPYLSDYWREYFAQTHFNGPIDNPYPPGMPTSFHSATVPPNGSPPGSDVVFLCRQVLDPWPTAYGILNCVYGLESLHNSYAAVALAQAINQWQRDHWLAAEPRLRASLVVPVQQPELAAEEIERWGDEPGFVQIALPIRVAIPYGNRFYYPIYEAAARHNLVLGLHFGGTMGNPPTPTGWPSYYIEEYAGMAQVFQSQLISLIVEGVFEQFPTLRVVLLESGVTWLPGLMWRLDKEWKGLRREIPWVKRLPSAYIREHIRLTLQPFDAPPDSEQLAQVFEQIGAEDLLLFATDYPHYHFAEFSQAFPFELSADARRKILYENASAFYGLEKPADSEND